MKNKLSKRILSLFLSVAMLATFIPFFAVSTSAAEVGSSTSWSLIASSDFTSTAGCAWNTTSNDADFTQSSSAVTAGDTTGVSLSWTGREYTHATATSVDANGTHISDGYLYLSGSSTGQVPVKGQDVFKIEIGFSIDAAGGEDNLWDDDYTFLKLGTTSTLAKPTSAMGKETVFTQAKSGDTYVNSASFTTNGAINSAISQQSNYIDIGGQYVYVLTYVRGYLRGYITDTAGNIVQTVFGGKATIDTNAIVSLTLGHASGAYSQNFCYRNIKFYSGVDTVNHIDKDPNRDKFLFAYFTGQASDDQEKLHFAVSTDGKTFEALNGNEPITDIYTPSEYYPSGGANMGMPASDHIRDPYIIQKRNADGSIGKGYYILATDLAVYKVGSYNNTKFLFWYVEDITDIDTAKPWCVETTPWYGGSTDVMEQTTNFQAWAPEAVWDNEKGMYMMFFSTSEDQAYDYIRLHYAYTRDFKTFYNQKMQEIGVNGVEPDILYEPYFGGNASYNKAIDGTILYNGELYYLYFKNEAKQQIYYATAEHANGPYSNYVKFSDSDFTSGLEGPEVYQLNDNSYTLMMDYYAEAITQGSGIFLSYSSTDLANGFSTTSKLNDVGYRMNHLSPRHGAVTYISTDEYNALVEKYGKSTYATSGLLDGTDVDDTLVARYFTTSDVTYDATGHGFNLSNNNATAVVKDGRATAYFANSGEKVVAAGTNGAYAQVNLGDMASKYDFNAKDGVTLDWYGYSNATNYYGRFFEVSNAAPGSVTYSSTFDYGDTKFAYYAGSDSVGDDSNATFDYDGTYANGWHHFTVTLTKGYMNVLVDGALMSTVYNSKTAAITKQGTPIKSAKMNESWFSDIFSSNGNLYFGTSVFDDELLNGYISDFRIYNRALSQKEISTSISNLSDNDDGTDVDLSSRVYYDPMEDTTINGTTYTGYGDKTISNDTHNNVLDMTYAGVSNYTYSGSSTDSSKGYTVSMFYNPGATVATEEEVIFNIGDTSLGDERHYLELHENGTLRYVWDKSGSDVSYIDAIDGNSLFGSFTMSPNTWYHLTLQIIPNAHYDTIKFYVDGTLTTTFDTFVTFGTTQTGRSVHDYLANDWKVAYGMNCAYWNAATDGMLDDFAIYNGIYNAASIFRNDNQEIADKLMDIAINSYKQKMAAILKNTGTVYTNMAQAYEVYDEVARYKDATDPKKGGKTADLQQLLELSEKMQQALAKMEEYSKPATVTSVNFGYSNTIDPKYFNNLISEDYSLTKFEQSSGTQSNVNAAILSSSFVWLYTGDSNDIPCVPVGCGVYANCNKILQPNRNNASIYPTAEGLTLGGLGYGGSDDLNWHIANNTAQNWYYESGNYAQKIGTTANDKSNLFKPDSRSTWYYGSSYLTYTGDPGTTMKLAITPAYYAYNNKNGSYNTQAILDPGTIYVINFKLVKDELTNSDRITKLANITDYSPSSVKPFLEAYDTVTSINYIVSSSSKVDEVVTEVNEKLNILKGQSLDFVAKADYTGALTAVVENTDFHDSVTVDGNGLATSADGVTYTTSSWNAYNNAYNAIQEHFASLDPYGDDMPYAITQDTVDRLTTNITKSREVLVEKADYENTVDKWVTDSTVQSNLATNNTDADGQLYTYTSWTDFNDAYVAAKEWSDQPTEYKNDTEKYKINYELNSYGPYIGFTEDGKLVTNSSITPSYYEYCGVFYDSADATEPSQFESGDYIMYNGSLVKLNGCRYYASSVDISTPSARQSAISTSANNLDNANTNLAEVGDYQNYDYSQQLAALADKSAYADDGAALTENVTKYGLSNAPATYTGTEGAPYIVVDGVTYKDANQSQADAATRDVLTDLNNKKTYTVTFNVVLDGSTTTVTKQHDYGTIVDLNAETVNPSANAAVVSSWTVQNDSDSTGEIKSTYLNNTTKETTLTIQANTTVTVKLSTAANETDKLISVVDYFGVPVDAGYVSADTTVTVTDSGLTYTDVHGNAHDVKVISSAYYTFDGYKASGKTVTGDYTVADDVVFTQFGTKSGNMNYAANSGTINGSKSLSNVALNTKLDLVAADTANFLVWVKSDVENATVGDWHIASYSPTFSTFSADSGFVYVAVSQSNYSTYLTDAQYQNVKNNLPFSFGTAAELIDGKFRMYCDFTYQPQRTYTDNNGAKHTFDIKVVEVGAVYSTSANTDGSLVKGGTGVRTVAANAYNTETNTYTITKSNAGSGSGNHYMRSYVAYTMTETITVNNENGEPTSSSVTVPMVAYGQIVKCENGKISK